jgi:Kdo2-lipid IVA lauroyltransferase/acyltransferase
MDAQAQILTYPKSFSLPKLSLKLGLSKFLQMRLNSFLFRFLPFAVSRFYLFALGKLYYFINRKEKKIIQRTIRYCFRRQMDEAAINTKVKKTFRGIIDHYHEKLYVGYSHFPRLLQFLRTRVRIEGEEELHKALAAGNGVLLVTGHFGAVEFLPGVLALNGYPTSMICRFQTNRLRATLGQRAEAVGLNLIDADDGNIILAAMKALKQGQIIITECDEFDEWRTDPKRHTYFLGNQLDADRTLELLKKRSGATVISALVRRDGHKRYTCKLTPVVNAGNIQVGEQCLQILESAVEANPEQWYQWKKLGKMIKPRMEVEDENQKCRYLAPEIAISVPDQA